MRRLALVLGCLLLAACGGSEDPVAETTPTTDPTKEPTTESSTQPSTQPTSYDVGGHELWGECHQGEAPYVIYLHGLGGSSSDLETVTAAVAEGRPDQGWCRYDRVNAGRSPSDPAERPLSASVDELTGFLTAAGVDGPVVLVAHSYGGLVAAAFAGASPLQTAGLVLADAAMPFEVPLFTRKVKASIRAISANNLEHVDLLAAYTAAARSTLPDVPITYVDAKQQDLLTEWGASGYPEALSTFVLGLSQGELVESDTDHLGVLDSPELVDAVLNVLG